MALGVFLNFKTKSIPFPSGRRTSERIQSYLFSFAFYTSPKVGQIIQLANTKDS